MNLNCPDTVATTTFALRWRAAALCLLLPLLAASVQAQVTVTLELQKSRFLPRESMLAKLKIVNFSGQTLVFGEDNHWLQFQIESETGEEITPITDPPPVKGRFTVESSIRATKELDIAPHYALERAGRYTLTATVHIKQWGKQLTAKPVKFDITNGTVGADIRAAVEEGRSARPAEAGSALRPPAGQAPQGDEPLRPRGRRPRW